MKKLQYILASKASPFSEKLYIKLKNVNSSIEWVKTTDDLNVILTEVDPDTLRHIFFFHWNWIVSKTIYDIYSCVVIHTSNLPLGKGGSPIQNQIYDDIWQTKVNAIKMIGQLDAGPIYFSEAISLQGTIDDIWNIILEASYKIILKMFDNQFLIPSAQIKEETNDNITTEVYKRRHPEQSEITTNMTIDKLYNHIRMLDGYDYPVAFLKNGNLKLEFTRAKFDRHNNKILADVIITHIDTKEDVYLG
jgi:methionyl-tRNA formyltransferase